MNESSGRKVGIARFFELPGLFLGGWTAVLFQLKARRDAEINERLAAREAENHDL